MLEQTQTQAPTQATTQYSTSAVGYGAGNLQPPLPVGPRPPPLLSSLPPPATSPMIVATAQ